MKRPQHCPDHECAPKHWRHVPNMTGDYDLDASIMHSNNPSVPGKLKTHGVRDIAYGPRSGYDGYQGYSGDD